MKVEKVFLGIDVGTGSARAGIFTAAGKMLGSANHPIQIWKLAPDFVEQSSEDIWHACCKSVHKALKLSGVRPDVVRGIGFDATCSLVVLDADNRPLSVSLTGKAEQNVIVWMDHRAISQAEKINRMRHVVLRYVGGVISPEMQAPKLLWLKENLPASWKRAARFLDLPDYLTFRATGNDTRSLCTTVCKWNYLGHRGLNGKGWDAGYFRKIGMGDLAEEKFRRLGQRIRPMGEKLGEGLTEKSAREMGLSAGTPVGVSIIDAHAGGLGVLGASLTMEKGVRAALNTRLALIDGTSSCLMAASEMPRFIQGVWGPYFSAMIPDFWLTEGGQSATGALIDHTMHSHPAIHELQEISNKTGETIYGLLNRRLEELRRKNKFTHLSELSRNLHIQPDFHGNRSPRANPSLRGMISGLSLSVSLDDLAIQYLATIQAVAYGTRHIIETMNGKGYAIKTLMACGGGTKNPVFLREQADITGCDLILPKEPEAVLLGAATLGSVAGGVHTSVLEAMCRMGRPGMRIAPHSDHIVEYHDKKYRVFHAMHKNFLYYQKMMQ